MAFHRLTVPTYYGGLPGGYDYLNNQTSGVPALFDGPRLAGPNQGTYLVGFGEDARSIVVNRGLKALADNTDLLDDYLHRDIAMPVRTADVTAGAPVGSITLTGPNIFLGAAGTPNTSAGFNMVFQVLDDEDKEIVDANLVKCEITAVSGGTIGSGGFSAGDVALTISPAIPAGKVYRVYYGTRGNLAAMPVDALVNIKVRSAQEVSALLEAANGAQLIGYNGAIAWADGVTNPGPTSVGAQLDKIVSDLSGLLGYAKIGATGYAPVGDPYFTSDGTVASQFVEVVAALNLIDTDLDATTALLNQHITNFYQVRTLTTTATMNSPNVDATIILNPGGGSFSLNLPAPSTLMGQQVNLINGDGLMSLSNKVTLVRNTGSVQINGLAADYELRAAYGKWRLISDGSHWHLMMG